MSGDKDNTNQEDPSSGAHPDDMDLTSYLNDRAPNVKRILREEEERTAALAAGNGAGEMDWELADTGEGFPQEASGAPEEGEEEEDDDPFVIVEEESLDISFDNLGEDEDTAPEEPSRTLNAADVDALMAASFDDGVAAEQSAEVPETPESENDQALPADQAAGMEEAPLDIEFADDGFDDVGAEEDDDLGPPLPDLSAPPEEESVDAVEDALLDAADLSAELSDDQQAEAAPVQADLVEPPEAEINMAEDTLAEDDFPDIEFVEDDDPADETPDAAEPLDLTDFDEGLDIAFDDDEEAQPDPAPAEETDEAAQTGETADAQEDATADDLELDALEIDALQIDTTEIEAPESDTIEIDTIEIDGIEAEAPALDAADLADALEEDAAPVETDAFEIEMSDDIPAVMPKTEENEAAATDEIDIPEPQDDFAEWNSDADHDTESDDLETPDIAFETADGSDETGADETGANETGADEDGEEDDDLGPPLPDLSAPPEDMMEAEEEIELEGEIEFEAAPEEDVAALEEVTAEAALEEAPEPGEPTGAVEENPDGELVLDIEGLEFQPSDLTEETGEEAGEDTGPGSEPAPEPEAAPAAEVIADPAKPVSVQQALMAAIELHRTGDLEGAARGYEGLVRRFPNSAAGWINLGIVLRRLGKVDAALVCLRRGVMLNPKDGAAWSNLGNALRAANFLEDAKRSQIKAISLAPGAAQIHYNMALVTRDFGDLVEADACFRRAELLGYENPDLAWDQSLNMLLSGNLEEGFEAYEARWNLPEASSRYEELPRWQGEPQPDKTILIHAEQGLGDSIHFCRYVPPLKSRAARVIFEVQPHLVELLKASPRFDGIEVHPREQSPVEADLQMPLLSAPILLPLGESVLPGRDAYLVPPTDGPRIADGAEEPRIGIAWAGKPTHKNDKNRSAGLGGFTALFDLLAARFYSLQVGPGQKQIQDLSLGAMVQDLSPAIRDFADTASLLQDLDLVITVDTSVAHLAGAMGKPVWVLLPFAPDWRWQLQRPDSPWYPTMRLFRQTKPGDWDGVFMQVRAALDDWIRENTDS